MNKIIANKDFSLQTKVLVTAVASLMLGSAAHASLQNHGDLEIYKGPQEALPVITLMLDVSGSMNDIDAPSGCQYNGRYFYTDNSSSYPYPRYYCKVGSNKYFRRIDNLKMGVSNLVKDPDLQGIVKIGIGTYPKQSGSYQKNGHIDIPAKKLNAVHKTDIDSFIKDLKPDGGTPAAQAYAEAGAYMMGTTTNKLIKNEYTLEKETFRDNETSSTGYGREDAKCVGWAPINLNLISASNKLIECNNWQDLGRSLRNSDLNGNIKYKQDWEWHVYDRRWREHYISYYKNSVEANDPLIISNNIRAC